MNWDMVKQNTMNDPRYEPAEMPEKVQIPKMMDEIRYNATRIDDSCRRLYSFLFGGVAANSGEPKDEPKCFQDDILMQRDSLIRSANMLAEIEARMGVKTE